MNSPSKMNLRILYLAKAIKNCFEIHKTVSRKREKVKAKNKLVVCFHIFISEICFESFTPS